MFGIGLDLESLLDGFNIAQVVVEKCVVQGVVPVNGSGGEQPVLSKGIVQGNDRVHLVWDIVLSKFKIPQDARFDLQSLFDLVLEKRLGQVSDQSEPFGLQTQIHFLGAFLIINVGLVFDHQRQRRFRPGRTYRENGPKKQNQKPHFKKSASVIGVSVSGEQAVQWNPAGEVDV